MQEWRGSNSGAAGQDAAASGGEAGSQPQSPLEEMGGRRPDWLPSEHLAHPLAVAFGCMHMTKEQSPGLKSFCVEQHSIAWHSPVLYSKSQHSMFLSSVILSFTPGG